MMLVSWLSTLPGKHQFRVNLRSGITIIDVCMLSPLPGEDQFHVNLVFNDAHKVHEHQLSNALLLMQESP